MRSFDEASVHRGLPYARLVEALEAAFREGAEVPLPQHHSVSDDADFVIMPAWNRKVAGVKLVTVTPGNDARDLPTVQATYTLFDVATGTPRATIDGTALTLRRTAAASALAARYLARPDASVLALFGAGALAPHLVRAHAAVRPIREVVVWNRTPARARATATRLAAEGFRATATTDRETAVRAAHIVSCATRSDRPLVEGRWLAAGSHVDLVGAQLPGRRESDAEVLTLGRVFVDSREAALAEAGDLVQPIAEGGFDAGAVAGELADLCTGRVRGRGGSRELTVFKSVGTALEDLAAAALLAADA